MAIDKEQVIQQLRKVIDPELRRDIVTLNIVRHVAYCDGVVNVKLEVTNPNPAVRQRLEHDVRNAITELGKEITQIGVEFTGPATQPTQSQSVQNNPLPMVKHIIAVGAGKGGVGKSTIAVNLAVGLARQGAAVGLLDGDIYGPSIPTLMGLPEGAPPARQNFIEPYFLHGIRTMSIGALVEDEKPLIWRGPMAHGAFRQLATQTDWGTLDYLIIDLPPGTGDVPLTMSQLLPLTGAVIVCTPQKVAHDDARRALRMFEQLKIPVLGVVENMSYFIGDDGKEYDIFGRGGAQRMAQEMGVEFLGAVPIHMQLRANSDAGNPSANFDANSKLAGELQAVARNVVAQVNRLDAAGATAPTISVS